MRRAGRVVGNAQGVAVLRSSESDPPEIGTRVLDDRLEPVGNVVDVFGPVEHPYLAVTPTVDVAPSELLGEVLYLR